MNPLARFEERVARLLEGSSTRLMRGQLQPVELAKGLVRAMEQNRTIGVGRPLVPNCYTIYLHPDDQAGFQSYQAGLERELVRYLSSEAKERGFFLMSRPVLRFEADNRIRRRRFQITAQMADIATTEAPLQKEAVPSGATARLDLEALRARPIPRARLVPQAPASPPVVLERFPFRLGRGRDNDLVLEDNRVSRHHCQITLLYGRPFVVDLGSTNGTRVNGEAIKRCRLTQGDVISLGGVEFLAEIEEP